VAEGAFVIKNEQDAWRLLEMAVKEDKRLEGAEITFKGWPKLEVVVRGGDLKGTLPGRYLPALQEYQDAVYKTYSYAKYKEYSLRRLTDQDKRDAQLVYKIEEGSSEFIADFQEVLENTLAIAVGRMSGEQILIAVIVSALLIGGRSMMKLWLDHKQDKNGKDLTARAIDALAKSNEALATRPSDADKNLPLFVEALRESTAARKALSGFDEASKRLVLSMDDKDKIVIDGDEYEGAEVKRYVRAQRISSEQFSVVGPAQLSSLNNSFTRGMDIGVKMLESGEAFHAKLDEGRLIDEEVRVISKALLKREAIWVHIEGKTRKKVVVDAYIHSVRDLTQKERDGLKKS